MIFQVTSLVFAQVNYNTHTTNLEVLKSGNDFEIGFLCVTTLAVLRLAL